MHNIFDKSLFFNKRAIFIPECDSTNDEIMRLIKQNKAFEGLVVHTDHQNKGKGQRGNIWLDEPKKKRIAFYFALSNIYHLFSTPFFKYNSWTGCI